MRNSPTFPGFPSRWPRWFYTKIKLHDFQGPSTPFSWSFKDQIHFQTFPGPETWVKNYRLPRKRENLLNAEVIKAMYNSKNSRKVMVRKITKRWSSCRKPIVIGRKGTSTRPRRKSQSSCTTSVTFTNARKQRLVKHESRQYDDKWDCIWDTNRVITCKRRNRNKKLPDRIE